MEAMSPPRKLAKNLLKIILWRKAAQTAGPRAVRTGAMFHHVCCNHSRRPLASLARTRTRTHSCVGCASISLGWPCFPPTIPSALPLQQQAVLISVSSGGRAVKSYSTIRYALVVSFGSGRGTERGACMLARSQDMLSLPCGCCTTALESFHCSFVL